MGILGNRREFFKHLLRLSRVKILYDRATANRFTILYCWVTLISALLLSALQGVILADNTQAVRILGDIVTDAGLPVHLAMAHGGHLQVCDSIPGQRNTNCTVILDFEKGPRQERSKSEETDHYLYGRSDHHEGDGFKLVGDPQGQHDLTCIYSLSWLEDTLHDSQREDVAILFYQIWMFTMGIVTILNESLPHLWTSLLGHILGGAWAASRIRSTQNLVARYRSMIVPGLCDGFDPLGGWWEVRLWHTVPIVIVNGVVILILGFLSWKLLKLYSSASFARVGASSQIHRMYKLVLTFSVGLQLSFFFSLASTAMWIDKVAFGHLRDLARHSKLYLATFIMVFVLEIPFLILGWKSIRKESNPLFAIFFILSLGLVAISSGMFASPVYRSIFLSWQFFATVSITAFVFLVLTTGFGIICRLNFRKGLADYLNVNEALEGVDFTPVYFPRKSEDSDDIRSISDLLNEKKRAPKALPNLKLKHGHKHSISGQHHNGSSFDATAFSNYLDHFANKERGASVYSDRDRKPIILSSSPPLISELGSPTKRMRRLTKAIVRAQHREKYPEDDWRRTFFDSASEESSMNSSRVNSPAVTSSTVPASSVKRSPSAGSVNPKLPPGITIPPPVRPSLDSSEDTVSPASRAFLARMKDAEESEASPQSSSGSGPPAGRPGLTRGATIAFPAKALSRLGDAPHSHWEPPSRPVGLGARQLHRSFSQVRGLPSRPQPF